MWHSIKNYAVKKHTQNCGQDSKAKRTQQLPLKII